MYICHPREVFLAGYSWFDGKTLYFNTQICSITFCLLAEPQTMLQLKVLMAYALFYCKVSSVAFCSFIAHLYVKFQLI